MEHTNTHTHTENLFLKDGRTGDQSHLNPNLFGNGTTTEAAAVVAVPSTSKVHVCIETGKDVSKSSDGYGDQSKIVPGHFDRRTISRFSRRCSGFLAIYHGSNNSLPSMSV
jgi:hypothetical protein